MDWIEVVNKAAICVDRYDGKADPGDSGVLHIGAVQHCLIRDALRLTVLVPVRQTEASGLGPRGFN